MSIIYDEQPRTFSGGLKIDQMNPHKPYLTHYSNLLHLQFILNNSTDRVEKHQAAKEVIICERKLAFWARHPSWNPTLIANETAKLKQQWAR